MAYPLLIVYLPRPMAFLTELATNATERDVHVIIYSGNDDSILSHRGSEGQYYVLLPHRPTF